MACLPLYRISPWFTGSEVQRFKVDELAKSLQSDGTVKSSRCKARESLGMRRTYKYAGMTKDEAQRSGWSFYEAVRG